MCGIIAVLSRPETRAVPDANALLATIDGVLKQLPAGMTTLPGDDPLRAAATAMTGVDTALRGDAGIWLMAGNREFISALTVRLDQLDSWLLAAESLLERSTGVAAASLERSSNLLTALRDAAWSLRKDRIRTALAVDGLAGAGASRSALSAYLSIQQSFSALDRLEVRGRDSAG
ncbi:MAG: glucosamine-6-phosphate synthase, partial [Actinobacteria bacterium]|nr:glucosamine-6-phosphate synthase [Actinomycetota bacterium]